MTDTTSSTDKLSDHKISLLTENERDSEENPTSYIRRKSAEASAPQSAFTKIMNKLFKGNKKVLFYAIGLLVSSVGNSIFFKKMTNHMTNYPYFLSQLTTIVYVPIFFGLVFYEKRFTNMITEDMMKFPKRKFFVMGTFDALSGIFMLFGGIHTSGSTQALLTNAVIPMTMILSYVILKTRYAKTQCKIVKPVFVSCHEKVL